MSDGFSVTPAPDLGDALIRVQGRADLAARAGLVLRLPDLGDRSFQPAAIGADGGDLLIRIGPEITERLDAGTHYDIVLPNAVPAPIEGNIRWPAIRPRPGGSRTVFGGLPGGKSANERTSPPPPPHPPPPPPPPPPPVRPRRRWLLPTAAATALGLGAGLWWALRPSLPTSNASAINASMLADHTRQNPGSISSDTMSASSASSLSAPTTAPAPGPDALASLTVPEVISRAGSASAIGQEGNHRLDGGKPDDGVLLLEAAAERGDANAMAHLGRLYDPDGFDLKGPIPSPDLRESAQYYRDASRAGDHDVDAARTRLHDTLATEAQSGDQSAALALKDFWP